MTLHTVDTLRLAAALTAAVLVALPASAPLATPAVAHPSSHLETYKVLTYNVAGMDLPSPITPATPLDIGDLNVYSHMDLSVRAHLIAARILGGAYDIVVLEEVWDNPGLADSMRDQVPLTHETRGWRA